MGCSFIAPIQKAIGKVVDVVAPIVAAIPGPWQIPAMVVVAVNTIQDGGDIGDVIKRVGTAYVAGQIGAAVGGAAGTAANEAATAAQYGTSLGSAQTAALAAQEAGMSTLGTTLGNVAASTASGATRAALTGGDVEDAILSSLVSGGINAGVQGVTGQIEGFDSLPPSVQNAAKNAISSQLQGRDPTKALVNSAVSAGLDAVKEYQPSMDYAYDAANNPADPNADSNPDLNGTMSEPVPTLKETPTIDQSGYPVQDLGITPENMESYQQNLKDLVATNGGFTSQWIPNTDGTYTMTYDDGSTIQADIAGNVLSSTNATDTPYTGTDATAGTATAAPKVSGAPSAPKPLSYSNENSPLYYGTSMGLQGYSVPSPGAKIGRQYDVSGASIFNLPDDVKSAYATGGSIEDLMAYLRNKS